MRYRIIEFQEVKSGLTLLTRKAVNTLTHYFNDPNSIAKSKLINSEVASVEEILDSNLSSRDKMILYGDCCQRWLDADKERSLREACT